MLRTLGASALCGVLGLALVVGPAAAQAPAPRPAIPAASKDPSTAPAGTYRLDPNHTTVQARIVHMNGLSYSNFRFGGTSGTLTWDPAHPEATKVDVTVDTKSIMTPVKGFPEELTGEQYLNAAKFPTAHFVSTSVRRTGPTKATFAGNLTLFGVTKPATFEIEMVGTSKNPRGNQVIGFTGHTRFKRSDFGFTAGVPAISDEIILNVDGEFDQQR
jgi:polyisoprenoid-binding protein YceI